MSTNKLFLLTMALIATGTILSGCPDPAKEPTAQVSIQSPREPTAEEKAASWQKEAEAVWHRNPHLSATAVAELVAKKLDGDANTIRRKIRR